MAELRDRFEKIAHSISTSSALSKLGSKPRTMKSPRGGGGGGGGGGGEGDADSQPVVDHHSDGAERLNGSTGAGSTLSKSSTHPRNINPTPSTLRKATSEVTMGADANQARVSKSNSMLSIDNREELDRIRAEEVDKIRAQEQGRIRKESEETERQRAEERERQWREETERMRIKHESELETIRKQERERIQQEERDRLRAEKDEEMERIRQEEKARLKDVEEERERIRQEEKARLRGVEEDRERIRQEERLRVRQELEEEQRKKSELQESKVTKVQEDDRLWWEDQVRREAEEEAVSRMASAQEESVETRRDDARRGGELAHSVNSDLSHQNTSSSDLMHSNDSITSTGDDQKGTLCMSLPLAHLPSCPYPYFSIHLTPSAASSVTRNSAGLRGSKAIDIARSRSNTVENPNQSPVVGMLEGEQRDRGIRNKKQKKKKGKINKQTNKK